MDGIRTFLEAVRDRGLAAGHLRGLLHVAIGRTLSTADGTVVSSGGTWREVSNLLKALRYDPELVRELGTDPDTLSPRDRERFWFAAVTLARVDSPEAVANAQKFADKVKAIGYVVGPPPAALTPPRRKAASTPPPPPEPPPPPPKRGKGKKK